jgi:hypothetical protein
LGIDKIKDIFLNPLSVSQAEWFKIRKIYFGNILTPLCLIEQSNKYKRLLD